MPPLIKVYEALGALGDGRVREAGGGGAEVVSSDRSKTYRVEVSADGREVSSNDNASYWQGYLGYPGIAVLLARGFLNARNETIRALSGIPWKQINRRFRNDYARATAEVARIVAERGGDFAKIRAEAESILGALRELGPRRGVRRRPAQ
ncbi:MAG TPA: hypothetical protein VFB33_12070 [Candidatus Binataceae bacterium]|jgi:hypothetical protein|nr:hypothetical protein [Candidatus Binataceae bacterium]